MRKRAFRFSVSDLLFLSFLILLVMVTSQKMLLNKDLHMPEQKLVVTIVAEQSRDFLVDSIQIGESVYQKGASQPFGVITGVEAKPAQVLVSDSEGNTTIQNITARKDIHITLEANGYISKAGSPIIDNSFFYLNQYLPVHTKQARFATRVIEIKLRKESI